MLLLQQLFHILRDVCVKIASAGIVFLPGADCPRHRGGTQLAAQPYGEGSAVHMACGDEIRPGQEIQKEILQNESQGAPILAVPLEFRDQYAPHDVGRQLSVPCHQQGIEGAKQGGVGNR